MFNNIAKNNLMYALTWAKCVYKACLSFIEK